MTLHQQGSSTVQDIGQPCYTVAVRSSLSRSLLAFSSALGSLMALSSPMLWLCRHHSLSLSTGKLRLALLVAWLVLLGWTSPGGVVVMKNNRLQTLQVGGLPVVLQDYSRQSLKLQGVKLRGQMILVAVLTDRKDTVLVSVLLLSRDT